VCCARLARSCASTSFEPIAASSSDTEPFGPESLQLRYAHSGAISIVDASQCAEQCTYANCRTSPPSGGCGLGMERALALPLLSRLRSCLRAPTAG
jgi:hypothetical protein